MTKYVVGFLFSDDLREVVLIEKTRPTWQAGKLNGVGGEMEEGEAGVVAMMREWREETGTRCTDWFHLTTLDDESKTWKVSFFAAVDQKAFEKSHTTTDEIVRHVPVADISRLVAEGRAIRNLLWLIPMALELLNGSPVRYTITEFKAISTRTP